MKGKMPWRKHGVPLALICVESVCHLYIKHLFLYDLEYFLYVNVYMLYFTFFPEVLMCSNEGSKTCIFGKKLPRSQCICGRFRHNGQMKIRDCVCVNSETFPSAETSGDTRQTLGYWLIITKMSLTTRLD